MARDNERIVLRRNDGSGAGVVFKDRKAVNAFLDAGDNKQLYTEESAAEAEAKQSAADQQVTDEQERARLERKGRIAADDKAVAAPARNRG